MRFRLPGLIIISVLLVACNFYDAQQEEIIDLSGTWMFKLDPDTKGVQEEWYNSAFNDSLQLPGTTDENEKGIFLDERADDRLSRVWFWEGAAWYQKEINVPESWKGKNVKLLLERTKDTYVWFDDINCGYENTLSAPQYFDLTEVINPGKHRITILVDNSKLPPVHNSFAFSEKTQTNWNGIVGRMEIQVNDPVWIEDVQVFPDIKNNQAKIRLSIGNITGKEFEGELIVGAESWNTSNPLKFRHLKKNIAGKDSNDTIEFIYDFKKEAPLWDEFDPSLIRLNLMLRAKSDKVELLSSKIVDFGMREFTRDGKYLKINGERIFLRGRIDCANYPLTGYPPMEKSKWLKHLDY